MLEPGLTMLDRAKLLPALVEARVACRDLPAAAEAASRLEAITATYSSPALVASAALARGRVELTYGRAGQAVPHLRRAARIWAKLDLPFDLAQARLLLARAYLALGSADEAQMEEGAARAAVDSMVAGGSGARRVPAETP